jgi:hypothetical protein
LPGGRRQKPIREIHCPWCGTPAVFAARQPYCPNCHWRLEKARRALEPEWVGTIFFLGWCAFIAYAFAHSWIFFLLGGGLVVGHAIYNLRTLRALPQSRPGTQTLHKPVSPGQNLTLNAVRNGADYSWAFALLAPGFAIAGLVSLVYTLHTMRTGPFDWGRLRDLIGPGIFTLIGGVGTWEVVKHRLRNEKILKYWVCVMGVVTEATSDGLRYRFCDLARVEHEGSAREYSGEYYEDMEIPVMYERENPKNNLPVSALYDEFKVTVKPLSPPTGSDGFKRTSNGD